jgi:glycosyltransferase involved in cell wall biosynthesis
MGNCPAISEIFMKHNTLIVDLDQHGPILPEEMERVFLVSNYSAPAIHFGHGGLDALAVYLAWKSFIANHHATIEIKETHRFRQWAMDPCPPGGIFSETLPPLPRAAVAALAYFPQAGDLQSLFTTQGRYALLVWFLSNMNTVLPGYDYPEWIKAQGSFPELSLAHEAFWRSFDTEFQKFCPIASNPNYRLFYLGWLRSANPQIFYACKEPQTIEAMLDSPALNDSGEGLTLFMQAYCEAYAPYKSLATSTGRLAYVSWFLQNESNNYLVTPWTLACALAPCVHTLGSSQFPAGAVGLASHGPDVFDVWNRLSSKEKRQLLGRFLLTVFPLIRDGKIPDCLIELLLSQAQDAPLADEYALSLLQQCLWEANTGNSLEDTEACRNCAEWYIRQQEKIHPSVFASSRQILRWQALGLLETSALPDAAQNFFDQRDTQTVSVLGWPDGMLGIGADSRMTAETFELAGICTQRISVSRILPFAGAPYPLENTPWREPRSLVSIICLAAQDIYRLWLVTPADWWAGRYNIGLCPWELPLWPSSAAFAVEMLDEIWAPSKFAANAFAACGKPVVHMPHAVIPPEPDGDLRAELGIAPDTIVFLTAYDSNASCVRKNPLAVIKAFNEAFADTKCNVRLIVKSMNAANHRAAWQELHDENRCGDKVVFIDEAFPIQRHARLLNTCDAFVSLHRSEGFGRLLAEAMSIGKLLICSNFGGNTDFSTSETTCLVDGKCVPVPGDGTYILSQGQEWFDADVGHAAEYMRNFATSPDRYAGQRHVGQQIILERHSCEAIGARAVAALKRSGFLA